MSEEKPSHRVHTTNLLIALHQRWSVSMPQIK